MNSFDATSLPESWDAMFRRLREAGWEETLLTFMFAPMLGGDASLQRQQRSIVEEIYGRMLTRIVRNPTRPSSVGRLPILLCSPDFPVQKRSKQSLRDVTINDGQHVHAYALVPPGSRLGDTSLTDFIRGGQAGLIEHTRCSRIDAVPITHRAEYVFGYTRKSEQRRRIDEDAFFVLPRTLGEVRDGPARGGRQS